MPVPVFLCAGAYSNSTFYRKYAGGALYRLVLSLVMFRRRSWMVACPKIWNSIIHFSKSAANRICPYKQKAAARKRAAAYEKMKEKRRVIAIQFFNAPATALNCISQICCLNVALISCLAIKKIICPDARCRGRTRQWCGQRRTYPPWQCSPDTCAASPWGRRRNR